MTQEVTHPELCPPADIIVKNGCGQRTQFAHGSAEPMRRGPYWCRIHFSGNQKGGGVGSKLDPEAAEEIYKFEGLPSCSFDVQHRVGTCGDDEQNKGHDKPYSLHPLAPI
jgi:hypothetical protein